MRKAAFQLYPGRASEREQLQALDDFLHWIYTVYSSSDPFLRDLDVVLHGLRIGERIPDWENDIATTFVKKLDPAQLLALQTWVRNQFEILLPIGGPAGTFAQNKDNLTAGFSRKPAIRPFAPEPSFIVWSYDPGIAITVELLRKGLLLLVMEALHGLNADALVRCATCDHITLRRHPRGKTFCSPRCRAQASVATRKARAQQEAQATSSPKRRPGRPKQATTG